MKKYRIIETMDGRFAVQQKTDLLKWDYVGNDGFVWGAHYCQKYYLWPNFEIAKKIFDDLTKEEKEKKSYKAPKIKHIVLK